MKAKIITLNVEEIITSYPPKPAILRLETSANKTLSYDDIKLNGMCIDYKDHKFELVVLFDADKHNEVYYVESEDFEKTMLFISDIIRREIDVFERKEIDYRVKITHLTDQLAFINNKWFVRFYRFLKKLTGDD